MPVSQGSLSALRAPHVFPGRESKDQVGFSLKQLILLAMFTLFPVPWSQTHSEDPKSNSLMSSGKLVILLDSDFSIHFFPSVEFAAQFTEPSHVSR